MKTPKSSPCFITRFGDDGSVTEQYVETRAPLPRERHRNARFYFRVMAEQETGEAHFVGYATTKAAGEQQASAHLRSHPEHRRAWAEKL